ncbi:hypothetical protein [Thiothrix winogradskyi]|uniref:Uncharacterized protein n=1 Tax=Thiothrix winogradskyi TaxID=96472 RepID=A0ABY3SXW2_9GAMM|nr:hypothetical protein [Thiothrix winogradskyi]UJS24286.1 hypothetical protein L2Y54_20505 [Thiothrix winogradskyi]
MNIQISARSGILQMPFDCAQGAGKWAYTKTPYIAYTRAFKPISTVST